MGKLVGPPGKHGGLQPLLMNRLSNFGGLQTLSGDRRNKIGGPLSWLGNSLNNFSGSLSLSGNSLNDFSGSLTLPGRRRNKIGGSLGTSGSPVISFIRPFPSFRLLGNAVLEVPASRYISCWSLNGFPNQSLNKLQFL